MQKREDIDRIRSVLRSKPRDLLLFDFYIRSGLKMGDLLRLRVRDLNNPGAGDRLSLGGSEKDGTHIPSVTSGLYHASRQYIQDNGLKDEDYLFRSRKGQKPLNPVTVSHMVKEWFKSAGLKKENGLRSLRNLWGNGEKAVIQAHQNPDQGDDPLTTIKPIETLSVQESIYHQLLKAILSGKIPPGARLALKQIAERFHVSLMPVREALKRLDAEGFVTHERKKGIVVNALTDDNLREIILIRTALEFLAADLACPVCTRETLSMAEGFFKKMVRLRDPEEFLDTVSAFQMTIFRDAKMPMLHQMIKHLMDKLSPYYHMVISMQGLSKVVSKRFIECHKGILDGMRRKDPAMVRGWIKANMQDRLAADREVLKSIEK